MPSTLFLSHYVITGCGGESYAIIFAHLSTVFPWVILEAQMCVCLASRVLGVDNTEINLTIS